jgi:hypothetical protein
MMTTVVGLMVAVLFSALALVLWFCRTRRADIWLPAYVGESIRPRTARANPVHVLLCVADHFEPRFGDTSYEQECTRIDRWVRQYPTLAARHRDSDGVPPQHTFFYPEEEYRPEHLGRLAVLCRQGLGDVEIHLHHHADTAEDLGRKLTQFKTILHRDHGLLHRNEATGVIEYGFIHGNWALDNSGPDGKHCGVNNELTVLRETGCYADFTLPAAPEGAQTRTINSIYYAADDPDRPKSHDTGVPVRANGQPSGDLMIVQGPLALNWRSRKFGILPRIETGELSGDAPPTPARADLWVRQGIHVHGRPEWVFVKLHTHGANERNFEALLGRPMEETLSYLESRYNDGAQYRLHYVTARQMFNIIKAAEAGLPGDPQTYRDFSATPCSQDRLARPTCFTEEM